jgi:hypothetical protein
MHKYYMETKIDGPKAGTYAALEKMTAMVDVNAKANVFVRGSWRHQSSG